MNSSVFDVPVALFLFKRKDTALRILNVIAQIRPQKLYLISDQGRNAEERLIVEDVRNNVENAITWDCEIVKDYADQNRGVYGNIGLGAKRVFEKEKWAIFLEDDNLPEITFFEFCRQLLIKYENNSRVLWICGTNYLGTYKNREDASYMFTSHQLPCGWASWADKYCRFYDGELDTFDDEKHRDCFEKSYQSKPLFKQQLKGIQREYLRSKRGERFVSWDSQMNYSVRSNGMLGISPCNNLIRNIGVDVDSIHGGTSLSLTMTKRFCEVPVYPMKFPLHHPDEIRIDPVYEKKIGNIILLPFRMRVKSVAIALVKKAMHIDAEKSLTKEVRSRLSRKR